jgi:polysaccharide export outer membrane protein
MNFKALIVGSLASLLLAITAFGQAVIKPGRAVTMTILGVPTEEKSRFDGVYPVSESGTVNMPHIGPVKAAGLRADELSRILQASYKSREIYTNPTIQVIDSSAQTLDKQMVHVGGQVRRPGPTEFIQGLTLYQAVQAGGGPTEFGSMKRVKLLRAGKLRQIDLTQAPSMSVQLEPGDTIEVPQKTILGN